MTKRKESTSVTGLTAWAYQRFCNAVAEEDEPEKDTEGTEGSVSLCGCPPEGHDARTKSKDGRCPHCGVGELTFGYGLAAGGIGSYSVCKACGRYCDSVQDFGG